MNKTIDVFLMLIFTFFTTELAFLLFIYCFNISMNGFLEFLAFFLGGIIAVVFSTVRAGEIGF